REATLEDVEVRAAYGQTFSNPRQFDLYVRERLNKKEPDKWKAKWKPLIVDENAGIDEPKELVVWKTYGNVWPFSREEARKLSMKDRAKLSRDEFKELIRLRGLANRGK